MFINDGTAKWQLRKYSEADSLNGLDLQGIVDRVNTQLGVRDCDIIFGDAKLAKTAEDYIEFTIPVPSGFTRQQCRYYCETFEYLKERHSPNNIYQIATWRSINQETGILKVYSKHGAGAGKSVCYIVFAKK